MVMYRPTSKMRSCACCKRIAQLLEVGIGGVEHRVADHALLLARRDLRLDLGDFLLEFAEHLVGVHGVDEDRDVEHLVHVDDRREPAGREEARVGDDEERAGDLFAEVDLLWGRP
jgi:hypothetical protein